MCTCVCNYVCTYGMYMYCNNRYVCTHVYMYQCVHSYYMSIEEAKMSLIASDTAQVEETGTVAIPSNVESKFLSTEQGMYT